MPHYVVLAGMIFFFSYFGLQDPVSTIANRG
jgi:hypothetical protein